MRIYTLLKGRTPLLLAIVFMMGGLIWLVYLIFLPRIVVDIEVEGNTSLATAEILRLSGLKTGIENDLSALNQAEEVLSLHPFIREVNIERQRLRSQDKLIIHIKERSCVALVQNRKDNDIIYEIDIDLMVLSENKIRCRGVPLIQGTFHKQIDRFDDVMLKRMVHNWKNIHDIYPGLAKRISEIRIRREGGMHYFLSGRAIRIDVVSNLDETRIRQMYGTVSWLESQNITRAVVEIRGEEVLVHGAR